jgi:hypothetical protein
MAIAGIAIAWTGFGSYREPNRQWIAAGATIFFLGAYQLVSTIAHLQISSTETIEIAEIIPAFSLTYLAIVSLRGNARKLGLMLAIMLAIAAGLISVRFIPPVYLLELVKFYEFFYPFIFAGLGLWIVFERKVQSPYPA